VPEGADVGAWVTRTARGLTAFYDIDTPVTLARLARGETDYLSPELIPRYDLYLSFTGGPTLRRIEREYGAPMARPLYCAVDPELYQPQPGATPRLDLGYMGTYSADRQPGLDRLLVRAAERWAAGRFAVVGPMYPDSIRWPANVERTQHLSPAEHRAFYTAQRFTLNITRADMIAAGWSPSVRLFEAAACGTPIVSDYWDGLESVLEPDAEILVARTADEVLAYLRDLPEEARCALGERARRRVLAEHTAAHRAEELERYAISLLGGATRRPALDVAPPADESRASIAS
jgi:spore maturation protein CgeB